MLLQSVVLVLVTSFTTVLANGCNADNCYRAVKAYQTATSAQFCSSYLASKTAAPSPFATCGPSRLSSACNCLATATSTSSTSTPTPTPSNLVINGGFESGSLTPWVVSDGDGYVKIATSADAGTGFDVRPRTGTYLAEFANEAEGPPTLLTQSLTNLTPGKTYTLTYYFAVFDMPLDGCTLTSTIAGTTVASSPVYGSEQGGPYYEVSGTYTVPKGETSADLVLGYDCESGFGGVIGVDDVVLE